MNIETDDIKLSNATDDNNKVLKSICALELYRKEKTKYYNNIVFIVLAFSIYTATLLHNYFGVLITVGAIVYSSLSIHSSRKQMTYLTNKYKVG